MTASSPQTGFPKKRKEHRQQAPDPEAARLNILLRIGALIVALLTLSGMCYWGRGRLLPLGIISAATDTPTPTLTFTPTAISTLTPTITFTPTITLTPSPVYSPTPLLLRRLENGDVVKGKPAGKGGCALTVTGGDGDAVVVIDEVPASLTVPTAKPGSDPNLFTNAIIAVYLRSNDKYIFYEMCPKVIKLSDQSPLNTRTYSGAFQVCFAQGEDWDSELGRFTRKASYSCLASTLFFTPNCSSLTLPTTSCGVNKKGVLYCSPGSTRATCMPPDISLSLAQVKDEIVPISPEKFYQLGSDE